MRWALSCNSLSWATVIAATANALSGEMADELGARMIDLKFTDVPGTWQHMTLSRSALEEDAFSDGLGFDGSSIRGFQQIAESDMLLMPDATTAKIDPFYTARTRRVAPVARPVPAPSSRVAPGPASRATWRCIQLSRRWESEAAVVSEGHWRRFDP